MFSVVTRHAGGQVADPVTKVINFPTEEEADDWLFQQQESQRSHSDIQPGDMVMWKMLECPLCLEKASGVGGTSGEGYELDAMGNITCLYCGNTFISPLKGR